MLKFIARIDAKPGKEALVAEALAALVEPSRAETGCIAYEVCRMKDDHTKLVVLEEWASQEALDEHMASAHFQGFLAKTAGALAGEPRLEMLERL